MRHTALIALCAFGALGGCTKTLGVDLAVIPACDQEDALNNINIITIRAEGDSLDAPREVSYDFSVGGGRLPSIPPTLGAKLSIFAFASESGPADVAGAAGPFDLSGENNDAPTQVRVVVGRVGTFAQTSEGARPSGCTTMHTGRQGHTATRLPTGEVLILGGEQTVSGEKLLLRNTEVYDPRTGKWSPAQDLPESRSNHTATLLDDGRIIICGGQSVVNSRPVSLNTCIFYDSSARRFIEGGVTMALGRQQHTATLLADGRVVIAGGQSTGEYTDATEIYDPQANTERLSPGPLMIEQRAQHTATLADDGKTIIFAGGRDRDAAQSAVEAWTLTGTTLIGHGTPRYAHSAAKAADGRIVFAGGFTTIVDNANPQTSPAVELYDPQAGGGIQCTAELALSEGRGGLFAAALPSADDRVARVLIGGGTRNDGSVSNLAEIVTLGQARGCQAVSVTFAKTALKQQRTRAVAVPLFGGDILLVGGMALIGAAAQPATVGEMFISPR